MAIFEWYLRRKGMAARRRSFVEFSDQLQVADVGIAKWCRRTALRQPNSEDDFSVDTGTGVHAFHRSMRERMKSGARLCVARPSAGLISVL